MVCSTWRGLLDSSNTTFWSSVFRQRFGTGSKYLYMGWKERCVEVYNKYKILRRWGHPHLIPFWAARHALSFPSKPLLFKHSHSLHLGHFGKVIHMAAMDGEVELVKKLTSGGERDYQSPSSRGISPLMYASSGELPVVKYLVEHTNCDLNATDEIGYTALHFAAEGDQSEIIKYLLEHNADYHISSIVGVSPMLHACAMGRYQSVKTFLQHDPSFVHIKGPMEGYTPLHYACKNGEYRLVKLLLEYSADPNQLNDQNENALMLASFSGCGKTVNLIIDKIDDIEATNIYGCSALSIAAWKGRSEVCRELIRHGADVNAQNPIGYADANHSWQTVKGSTALHMAIEERNKDVFKVLVELGGDLEIERHDKHTPKSLLSQLYLSHWL
eukprot:CAMPEP_0174253104 /NCGR_PEP_ID=MMETSP0439-20130205/2492_1 /TAXON_ID=0 /ORGANISM="Stereomyxa ramosa, Strain Chinc5" /LENGTH=385 /DNA_ID=CAMNT_0015333951 /DNA_START=192 /DNA_END=1349 /DNA_ORIENTATION=+